MKQPIPAKRPLMGLLICIFLTGFIWLARAETFFVYVEESEGNGQSVIDSVIPAVREGLLDGMFELGHITFDDGGRIAGIIDWVHSDFKQVINKALNGGARFLVVIKSFINREDAEAAQVKIEQLADYYIFDVEKVLLVKEGKLARTNVEKKKAYDPVETGFKFGKELSLIINGVWENSEEQDNLLVQS